MSVPIVTRAAGVSDEAIAASAAETSIFAGRMEWSLEFWELLERSLFATVRNAGFFVLDARRRSLSHHLDSGEGQTAAMFALIDAAAAAEAGGAFRLRLEALDSVPATRWRLLDSADDVLTDTITPAGFSLGTLAQSAVDALNPTLPKITFHALWKRLSAVSDSEGTHLVAMLGDVSGVADLWTIGGVSTLPDFTLETLGDALLDGSWGYTATLPA